MEITIGVAVGSSIQIAAGMIPLLVLIAWPMGKDLTLFFVSFFFFSFSFFSWDFISSLCWDIGQETVTPR